MTDQVDSTNDNILLLTEAAAKRMGAAPPEAQATGVCLSCGEELGPDVRWCDASCRDDWEREKRRGK